MTHVIIAVTILGLGPLAADPALAQQVTAAIVADPPADKEFPAALAVVSFPSAVQPSGLWESPVHQTAAS